MIFIYLLFSYLFMLGFFSKEDFQGETSIITWLTVVLAPVSLPYFIGGWMATIMGKNTKE